jgi:hypothetical protein
MPNGDVDQALGSISLSADTIPHHDSEKIDYGDEQDAARAAPSPAVDRLGHALSDAGSALCDLLFPGRGGGSTTPPPPDGPVRPNTEEGFFLLATYCFDLERKMEYLYRATRAFALKGDPALARELLADQESFNVDGLTWKERAKRSEARLRELQRQIGPEHERLLRQVAAGGAGPAGGPAPGE